MKYAFPLEDSLLNNESWIFFTRFSSLLGPHNLLPPFFKPIAFLVTYRNNGVMELVPNKTTKQSHGSPLPSPLILMMFGSLMQNEAIAEWESFCKNCQRPGRKKADFSKNESRYILEYPLEYNLVSMTSEKKLLHIYQGNFCHKTRKCLHVLKNS